MEAVFGVLSTVLGAIASFFTLIGDVHNLIIQLFGKFGVTFFMIGFIGLLMAFLWFLFRFIDKKRLALPTIIFTLFFLIFLSGNLLMLAQQSYERKSAEAQQVETAAQAELGEDAMSL